MDDHGNPVVADFGLSTGRFKQSLAGNVVSGTRYFIAPEQYKGVEATQRIDIFAWGVILYLLLSGRYPFDGNAEEVRERIENDGPPDDLSNQPGIPAYLSAIVMKCLKKNTSERYGSFRSVLEAIRDGERDEHRPPLKEPLDDDVETSGRSVGIDDLQYHRRWLDYVENAEAEKQLDAFCNDPRPFLWWGVVGPGGVGKSRLVYEHVCRLRRDGLWDAGFLRVENDDLTNKWLATDSSNWRPRTPTVIVIDYAGRFPRSTLSCLLNLSATAWQDAMGEGVRVRVLLLDRPGSSLAPVSFEKLLDGRTYVETRDTVRKYLYRTASVSIDLRSAAARQEPVVCDAELLLLGGIPQARWRDVLTESMTKAAGASSVPALPRDEHHDWWRRVHRLTDFGRPLFLQILGICFARRPDSVGELTAGDTGLEGLLDDMLRYEREHRWVEVFDEQSPGAPHRNLRSVEHAVGIITLVGGVTWPRDEDTIRACVGGSWDATRKVVGRILGPRQQPDTQSVELPALQPDLLGERLLINLARRVIDQGTSWDAQSPADPVNTDTWLGHALTLNAPGAIETLYLVAQDFPHDRTTIQWTESLLRKLAARFAQTADADDTIEGRKSVYALSSGAAKVVQTLSAANVDVQRDEHIGKLVEELSIASPVAFFGVIDGALLGSSIKASATILEVIAPVRQSLAGALIAGDEDILSAAHECLSGAIAGPGGGFRWTELAFWVEWMRELVKSHFGNEKFLSALARSAVRAIKIYCEEEPCRELESRRQEMASWKALLRELAESDRGNEEIQNELAGGAATEISHLGIVHRWDDLEWWGAWLRALAESHAGDDDIQLALAIGAGNAMWGYGRSKRWGEVESWGAVLRALAESDRGNEEIQKALTFGAVSAIIMYRDAERCQELESWKTLLRELESWKTLVRRLAEMGNEEIQGALAVEARNTVLEYGRKCCWGDLTWWGALLRELAESHPGNEEMQSEYARGAVNAMSSYRQAKRWQDLESWGAVLRELAENHPGNDDIQLALAFGAFNAMLSCCEAKRWRDLESWGAVLRELVESHPGNEEMQSALAKCAVNAMLSYREVKRWRDLESWAAVLRELAENHPGNDDIQLALTRGAVIVLLYDTELSAASRNTWTKRLSAGLVRFGVNDDNEDLATTVGLCLAALNYEGTRDKATKVLVGLARLVPRCMVRHEHDARPLAALVAALPDLDEATRDELQRLQ